MARHFFVRTDRVSPNHGPRADGFAIDILLIHYTGMGSTAAALDRLTDPAAAVSAHYLIDEEGKIWSLVAEERRAWHAGRAYWGGETDINSRSIGIELANSGHDGGSPPFAERQIASLESLALDILKRHAIPPRHVLGHSDVAIGRKRDPGERFDWRRLAKAGIGLWSEASDAPPGAPAERTRLFAHLMRRYGYPDASPGAVAAFQRHFRQTAVTGIADEETLARLFDLAKQAGVA